MQTYEGSIKEEDEERDKIFISCMIKRKHIVSKFTSLRRKTLCCDLQKLDNTRRTYDMMTISKDQTISSIYIGAGGS
jgi:hypothetical protein